MLGGTLSISEISPCGATGNRIRHQISKSHQSATRKRLVNTSLLIPVLHFAGAKLSRGGSSMQFKSKRRSQIAFLILASLLFVSAAVAGPPLICHPFDIGNARSLPWVSHDWNLTGGEGYDTANLAADTLVILNSSDV